jgi:hypothetical protein
MPPAYRLPEALIVGTSQQAPIVPPARGRAPPENGLGVPRAVCEKGAARLRGGIGAYPPEVVCGFVRKVGASLRRGMGCVLVTLPGASDREVPRGGEGNGPRRGAGAAYRDEHPGYGGDR